MAAYTQTWFINGRCLGVFPAEKERTHEQYHAPRSYAWACPHCGEVWARRAITPHTRWFFWTVCCRACAPQSDNKFSVPGSIWTSSDHEFLLTLPLPILRHETELLLGVSA